MATHADIRETGGQDRVKPWFRALWPWKVEEDNVEGLMKTYGCGLYVTARGLSDGKGDALGMIATRLQTELSKGSIDFCEILAIETELTRLLPSDIRQRRYWEYRSRFERVASPAELAAYLASNPPRPPSGAEDAPPPAACDADNLVLLNHIHKNYLVTVLREQAVRDLKRWIQRGLVRGLVFYGTLLLIILIAEARELIAEQLLYFGIGITFLYLLGRLGAATSVVQRLQAAVSEPSKDPFFEVTALCTGRRGVSIAMMIGGIFALLLYVVFAAGLGQNLGMSGGLFPQVEVNSPADQSPDHGTQAGANEASPDAAASKEASGQASAVPPAPKSGAVTLSAASIRQGLFRWRNDECSSSAKICIPSFIGQVGKRLGFRDYPDFFKMLLLAFLAGFAERLVPDAIDRLIRRQSQNGGKVETTVKAGS